MVPKETDVLAPVDPATRAKNLFQQYLGFRDGEVTVSGGEMNGRPAILIEWTGAQHVFYTDEATKLADALEATLAQAPDFWAAGQVADLIMMLRLGVDGAESARCSLH